MFGERLTSPKEPSPASTQFRCAPRLHRTGRHTRALVYGPMDGQIASEFRERNRLSASL
jgi:hypothetical protein